MDQSADHQAAANKSKDSVDGRWSTHIASNSSRHKLDSLGVLPNNRSKLTSQQQIYNSSISELKDGSVFRTLDAVLMEGSLDERSFVSNSSGQPKAV